jgi:hypothetical protein
MTNYTHEPGKAIEELLDSHPSPLPSGTGLEPFKRGVRPGKRRFFSQPLNCVGADTVRRESDSVRCRFAASPPDRFTALPPGRDTASAADRFAAWDHRRGVVKVGRRETA